MVAFTKRSRPESTHSMGWTSRFAKVARKPVIVLRHFGSAIPVPQPLAQGAAEILDWDGRALVDAFRRHARGEDTSGWEVVEFKLD